MHVIILRHGDAVANLANDSARMLSELGQAQGRLAATALKKHKIVLRSILCSPLLRARQTAEIVRAAEYDQLMEQASDELAPGADCGRVADVIIRRLSGDALLVCHQPFAGRMIQHLTGVETRVGTGMLACVRLDSVESSELKGELEWIGPDTGV